jgi:hypothetical protein
VWLLALVGLALTCYAVNALHYGQMPLRIEESEWPPMAEAIFDSGEPVIAAGDTHRVRYMDDLQVDQSPLVGAWHPPLYLYTLAASMAVVGDGASYALRGVGVIGLLASALLMLLIAREVTPRWRTIGGIAAALLLVHPFAIQGSLFLDIDNTIYTPLALLVLWLAIRFSRGGTPLGAGEVMTLGAALALVSWAKLTTTIALVGVLVVWWLLTRRPLGRAAIEASAFVAVGAALFTSTYGLWCAITGIPFSYTFDVTFVQKSNRLFSDWLLVENAAHWHLRWVGAALLVLAMVYLVDLLRNLVATRRLRELDLLFLFGVGILVNYVLASPTDGTYQGKYAFPVLATLLLPVVWMLLRERREPASAVAWVGAAVVGVVTVALMPDVLTNLSVNGDYGTWGSELLVVLGCAAALSVAWWLRGRVGFAGGVLLVLAMLLVAQGVRSYRSDHSPMYPVPDTADFRSAATELNDSTRPREIVVVPKDLGFYVENRVVEGEDAFARGDARLAAAIRRYPHIVAVARDSFGPPIGPETAALVDRCFLDRRALGSVLIAYRSKACRQPAALTERARVSAPREPAEERATESGSSGRAPSSAGRR